MKSGHHFNVCIVYVKQNNKHYITFFSLLLLSETKGPQLSSGLASLASNHRLSPLCGFDPRVANLLDLVQYDPDC